MQVKQLNHYNSQQIEDEVTKWMNTLRNAMDKVIPKSAHRYIYQLLTNLEIQQVERSGNK